MRRKAGGKTVTLTQTFESLKEAQDWAQIQEGKVVGDEYVDRKAVRAMTVGQACEWFMDRVAPLDEKTGRRVAKSQHGRNQLSKLKYWIGSEFANWSLVSLKPWDLIEWRDELLDDGECSAQTIVHRLNTLSQVYVNVALAQKIELTNPVGEKVRPSLGPGRDRRLDVHPDKDAKDEEARLLEACAGSTRAWLRSAVIISLETCMRQAELAGLTWDRVKLDAVFGHLLVACDMGRHFAGPQVADEVPHVIGLVGAERDAALGVLDLPGKSGERFLRLCGFGLEAAWAFVSQGGMPPDGIIEAVDIAANGDVGLRFLSVAIRARSAFCLAEK